MDANAPAVVAFGHPAAQGLGQELMTEADGYEGNVGEHEISNELFDWRNPWKLVVGGIG